VPSALGGAEVHRQTLPSLRSHLFYSAGSLTIVHGSQLPMPFTGSREPRVQCELHVELTGFPRVVAVARPNNKSMTSMLQGRRMANGSEWAPSPLSLRPLSPPFLQDAE
jgi:hypothetical protein